MRRGLSEPISPCLELGRWNSGLQSSVSPGTFGRTRSAMNAECNMTVARPTDHETFVMLMFVASRLDFRRCFAWHGQYHFTYGRGLTLSLTPESAGRFRIEACRWTRPVATLWAFAEDLDRV